MKKATSVIALAITILIMLGTVMFYFMKNVPSTALHIQTVYPTTGQDSDALVDLNTATKEQLMVLQASVKFWRKGSWITAGIMTDFNPSGN